ncbi:hypothetical protein [Acetobacter estunensis]|nr:hypothetical protein [Acetobacter estunensis]MBV1837770.1 hypothetical protein [Acetobacter estunensis]
MMTSTCGAATELDCGLTEEFVPFVKDPVVERADAFMDGMEAWAGS